MGSHSAVGQIEVIHDVDVSPVARDPCRHVEQMRGNVMRDRLNAHVRIETKLFCHEMRNANYCALRHVFQEHLEADAIVGMLPKAPLIAPV
jgi:hypothetical protein